MLPAAVLRRAQAELLDWGGRGVSVMEISHRSPDFMALAADTEARLRQLLDIGDEHVVLFLAGGATAQFSQIPMNLATPDQGPPAFVINGHWGHKASQYAALRGPVHIAARSDPLSIPPPADWNLPDDSAYVHITSNETVDGNQFAEFPQTPCPLVADMSSDLLSRALPLQRFGVIYASAQKNLGPAGVTVVIIRRDLLERAPSDLPPVYSFPQQLAKQSMMNTPVTFSWYLTGLVFEWVAEQGGVEIMAQRAKRRSAMLYDLLDRSGFYRARVPVPFRSRMNVTFDLAEADLLPRFVQEAEAVGLQGLKGHRVMGGLRASLYNALPLAAVEALVAFMNDFEQRWG